MKMFLLSCKVAPTPEGPHAQFAGGFGIIFVWTDSADRVETLAETYLLREGWLIDERKGVHEAPYEMVADDAIHRSLYRQAQQQGYAMEISRFEGYAK
jgi:hypothetical protein